MSEGTGSAEAPSLAEGRDLVFAAVQGTRTPMVICDPRRDDNPIILANQAFLTMTGYARDEVIGRNCRFLQGPLTNRAAVETMRAAISQAREIEVEILNYRKDGSTFWNRVSLSPVHDEAGALIYFFGSQVDVTHARRAEANLAEETRILLREIDHRAMNALAIVEGIVRLSRAHDVKQYAAAVQQRVQALARTHAFLSERRWRAADLEEVMRLQIEPFGLDRATLEGPAVPVAAPLVQPVALVLHEMVANAAAHGCLSAPGGVLRIGWSAHNGPHSFHIVWEETGGPPPRPVRTGGFGSAMVTAIVERQLRGQARLAWPQTGLRAELIVPDTAGDPRPFRLARA